MKQPTFVLFIWMILMNVCLAQNPGESMFDNSYVHEVRITFEEPEFWQLLNDNYYNNLVNDVPTNVPYLKASLNFDGTALDSIGVRQKGFSSHFLSNELKKSLKLDFNEFIDDQSYDGLKKINLNNGVGDPAMQRDILAYNLMRNEGIRAPRTSYAKVFINETYWGLYMIVEQVDKTFLENNFPDDEGDLYKNIGWSTLEWNGPDSADYAQSIALRTNKTNSDFSDFIEFVDILNNSSDSVFIDTIESIFNVDYYLKILAIDIMLDNWDSYVEHGRNFYMYHEPISGQFHWIPWDYNLSMGGDFFTDLGGGGYDTIPYPEECETILNGSCPYPPTDSVFLETIMQDEYCCNQFWDGICQELYDDISEGSGINPEECESILNGSCPYEADDPLFLEVISIDPTCCTENWAGFCQAQYDILLENLGPNYYNLPLIINNPQKTLIDRILKVPEYRETYLDYCCRILEHNFTLDRLEPMIDYNGELITEAVSLDTNFNFTFEQFNYDLSEGGNPSGTLPTLKEFLHHRIPLLEQEFINLDHDCESLVSSIDWHDVVINEFVASNDSLSEIADQDGEYNDWIEIYNNTQFIIDLSDIYITNNFNFQKQWVFPDSTRIGVDEYLIVWADKDVDQANDSTNFHSNFKLSKDGGELMLSHYDGTVIDSFSYGIQAPNIPSARLPNGTGDFTESTATFAADNYIEVINAAIPALSLSDFSIYPQPASDHVTLSFDREQHPNKMEISILNLLGQTVYQQFMLDEYEINIPVYNWPKGVYLVEVEGKDFKGVKKLVVE